eukprot:11604891-Karenia_brevis.AAC.1
MELGRWLFTAGQGALDTLDTAYECWACSLLGAQQWRNGAVAASELGWVLSGSGRAMLAVALRRARAWQLPQEDLYGHVFLLASAAGH